MILKPFLNGYSLQQINLKNKMSNQTEHEESHSALLLFFSLPRFALILEYFKNPVKKLHHLA